MGTHVLFIELLFSMNQGVFSLTISREIMPPGVIGLPPNPQIHKYQAYQILLGYEKLGPGGERTPTLF